MAVPKAKIKSTSSACYLPLPLIPLPSHPTSLCRYVKPGQLMALMGASGAGKTTLLDVLAQRKTGGHVSGRVQINGKSQDKFFPRISGYVEQTDIHAPRATILESLHFSARLRREDGADIRRRQDAVYKTLDLLGLTQLGDAVLGSEDTPGGLPPEARKRVTIGVELVANPSIIFLDEPTSGLDASAALVVMAAIRRVADTNRAVICTVRHGGG